MSVPSVTIVVLSYNGRDLTLDCIRSLQQLTYPRPRILIIDNASQDDSVPAIRREFSSDLNTGRIQLHVQERNRGFAGGNNVGIRLSADAEYVLLLNNDTTIAPDALDRLVEAAEARPSCGLAGPLIYYFEPRDQIWFAGTEVRLGRGISRHRGIRQKDRGQYHAIESCDAVTGCAMLIRQDVVRRIGLLDERYPLYSEDTDFCMRARQAGFEILFVPTAKVWHKISAATGGQFNWRKVRLRTYSNFLFLIRHARWYHWLTIPFFQLLEVARVIWLVASKPSRT